MHGERLRDSSENWGLSQTEYAHREKLGLRERMKKRQQRARMKIAAPPMVPEPSYPQVTHIFWRLKGQDIQELGIIAVTAKMVTRAHPNGYYALDKAVPMSLPYVSMIHGVLR